MVKWEIQIQIQKGNLEGNAREKCQQIIVDKRHRYYPALCESCSSRWWWQWWLFSLGKEEEERAKGWKTPPQRRVNHQKSITIQRPAPAVNIIIIAYHISHITSQFTDQIRLWISSSLHCISHITYHNSQTRSGSEYHHHRHIYVMW